MIRDIILPQLSMGMSEGTVVEWHATEGDRVKRDQPLVSVETEKVVTELPAPYDGIVHLILKSGELVPIETVIARIADTEEEYRTLLGQSATAVPQRTAADPDAGASEQPAKRPTELNGPRVKSRIPMVGMRRTIADRMLKAKTLAAQTYIFFEVDVTKMMEARKVWLSREAEFGVRISTTAIYARAVALACREVPLCNAALIENEVVLYDEVNIGIGVAVSGRGEHESGLAVPVVKNVESKGLVQISRELRDLVARARDGVLTAADVADSTFTISSGERLNTGGWMIGTAILVLPQVMSFSPNAPMRRPVVTDDDKIEVRTILPCSLTFDHRAMDGEPAARFGKKLTELLNRPDLMLS